MVLTSSFVESDVLSHLVIVDRVRVAGRGDLDRFSIDVGYRTLLRSSHDQAGIDRNVTLHASAHDRRFGDQQGHGLPLHVGAHQRTIGIVVLQERNQSGGNADHLARCYVDVFNRVGLNQDKVAAIAGDEIIALQFAVHNDGIGRR